MITKQFVFDAFNQSKDATNRRRQILREDLKLFHQERDDDTKIRSNLSYRVITSFLAMFISDEPTAIFEARSVGDEQIATNVNNMYAYDNDALELTKIRYQNTMDFLLHGVGIRVCTGYEENGDQKWTVVSPLDWYPDWNSDLLTKARYHFFDRLMCKEEMIEHGFSRDAVKRLSLSNEKKQNLNYMHTASAMNDVYARDDVFSLIQGYIEYKDEWYFVAFSPEQDELLKVEKMRENEECVAISYFMPLRGDPFGISLLSIIRDRQKALTRLENLRMINATHIAFGRQTLYDSRVVNPNDLRSKDFAPSFIPFDSSMGVPIQNAVYPVPVANMMQEVLQVIAEIEGQVVLDTGVSNRTLGVSGGKEMTKGEAQQIQENQNLRFSFTSTVSNWGEQDFLKIWYQKYVLDFGKGKIKKKFIRVNSAFGMYTQELKRADIIFSEDPRVATVNKKQKNAENAQQAKIILASLGQAMANPGKPNISKVFLERKAYELQGIPYDQVLVICPPSIEELDANKKLKLINSDILAFPEKYQAQYDKLRELNPGLPKKKWDRKNLFQLLEVQNPMQTDLHTYLYIYNQAIDCGTKDVMLDYITNLIITTGQNKMEQQTSQAQANAGSSQMMAHALSNNGGTDMPTTKDISNQ